MVRLTIDLIARVNTHTKRKRDEPLSQYLRRLTHLYFQERHIDEIDDLSLCKNLSVLYLYDNRIARIQNLHFASNLTHLYLQNNLINKIENLSLLRRLEKLYLGSNEITVVEGLDKLENLKELHIENQRLPPGEKLLFDPRSIQALSATLCVLNVSGNNLEDLQDFRCLGQLNQFMAADNQLEDMKELAQVLTGWVQLWRLELVGNPLCRKAKYRDRVIVMSASLEVLDGKEINETARKFLLSWKANKEARRRQREDRKKNGDADGTRRVKVEVIPAEEDQPESLDSEPADPEIAFLRKLFGQSGPNFPMMTRDSLRLQPLLQLPSMPLEDQTVDELGNVARCELPPLQLPHAPLRNYIMPGLPGARKQFEAILARSRSLPGSADVMGRGDMLAQKTEIIAELPKKSLSDLQAPIRSRYARILVGEPGGTPIPRDLPPPIRSSPVLRPSLQAKAIDVRSSNQFVDSKVL
ncbi:protein phosphatase 1 regulatory subunit 42-like isoform X1 [Branchiostoma floridae]|uniref:Protein phosphatase 1 regulatory subunit 42-like isoform X1 n=1 Tax=Branchiostoma floridae TaxID=7739 RepID=A0A9J7KMD0_BRAFL|nr:protein phosphatase 1 regulatory subunit 42-like isoform X1 [Branchiostoma floridae]